jgi:hypothetical protein
MNKKLLALMVLSGSFAACAHDPYEASGHLSEDFGSAVRHNIAVQTINPDAGGPDASETLDGQSVERAIENMRERSPAVRSDELLGGLGSGGGR